MTTTISSTTSSSLLLLSLLIIIAVLSSFTSILTFPIKGCIAWQANQNQNYKNNIYNNERRSRSAVFHQVTLQQSGNNVKSRLFELSSSSSNTVDDNDQETTESETETIEPQQQQSSSFDVLNGVKEFESWFSNLSGNTKYCDSNISHTSFNNGNLRGLGKMMTSPSPSTQDTTATTTSTTKWITIPRSIILQSDYRDKDWDSQLAQSLWKEVCKGTGSSSSSTSISGYVSLLTRGVCSLDDIIGNSCTPPFTAPDALRHWTKDEKDVLLKTNVEKGQKLLDLQIRQEKLWKEKYNTIIGGMTTTTPKMTTMTWEQFEWSMEAVHSRAFKGDFGIGGSSSGDGNTGVLPLPVKIGAPVLSAVIGYIYKVVLHGQQDEVLIGLAILAAIPSIINIFNEFNDSSSSSPVAVLLPLIDSANHDENADSLIEYNPLTDSFDLSGSELKCLGVTEVDADADADNSNGSKQQLYISYGKKSPTELLLNYGFLNNNNDNQEDSVSSSGSNQDNSNDDNNDTSTRRKKLAEKFITL